MWTLGRPDQSPRPPTSHAGRTLCRTCSRPRPRQVDRQASALDQGAEFKGTELQALDKLRQLHPSEDPLSAEVVKLLEAARVADVPLTDREIMDASRKLARGSAAGPSGWTAELLQQALECSTFRAAFVHLANEVAANRVSLPVRTRLNACRLVAVPKSESDIRPIAGPQRSQ